MLNRIPGKVARPSLSSGQALLRPSPQLPSRKAIMGALTATSGIAGENWLQKVKLVINPASASTGDFRALYARSDINTNQDVFKAAGGSAYLFHNGAGGTLTFGFGSTNQFFLEGAATVNEAYGAECAVWNDGASTGTINTGRGSASLCVNLRPSGTGYTKAVGAYNEFSNRNNGTVTSGFAHETLASNQGSGTVTSMFGSRVKVENTGAGTVTDAYGVRIESANTGTFTNLYLLFILAHSGSAPASVHRAIYSASTAASTLTGELRLGDDNATGGMLNVEQSTKATAARIVRTDPGVDGPIIARFHDSASPAASDNISYDYSRGRNSSNADYLYAYTAVRLSAVTAGAESAGYDWITSGAGTRATRMSLFTGLVLGSPTGGDQGTGSLNATSVKVNNDPVGTLAAANTWTAKNTFQTSTAAGTQVELIATDAGTDGATLSLYHNSASAAVNDFSTYILTNAQNSTPAKFLYGYIAGVLVNATATSEAMEYQIVTARAGARATRLTVGAGTQVGAPAGGDPGIGHLAVAGAFLSSAPVTKTGTSGSQAAADSSLIINASGTYTLTLLSAGGANTGRWLYIKSIAAQIVNSASSNVVPIGSATAGTAIFPATAGKFAVLQSDGTNWVTMAAN